MISWLSTICLSTVSPSPLTAEAQSLSPETSQPYGSWKPEVTNRYISLRFINISISHNVKRSQKSMNMSATNDYEGRNSPPPGPCNSTSTTTDPVKHIMLIFSSRNLNIML
jgi:hypothetical protein